MELVVFKWFKRLFFILLFGSMIILGIVFTSENNTPVSLWLFGFELPSFQLGLWLLISLLLGSLVGLLLTLIPNLHHKQQLVNKDRKINKLQKELDNLRKVAVKG